MGLHCSGTHALAEYLDRFFSVNVEPRLKKNNKRVDSGTVELADGFKIWKHTVPLGSFNMPNQGAAGGRSVVLLTVREIHSWMVSLSNHPYEVFPRRPTRRKKGALWWMFEDVQLRTSGGLFEDPFEDTTFSSVLELWVSYMKGYIFGTMAQAGGPIFLIIRYEDLVQRPRDIVDALERLGMPRNTQTFEPIEEYVSGNGTHSSPGSCLQSIAKRVANCDAKREFSAEDAKRLRSFLLPHWYLLEWLGYSEDAEGAQDEDRERTCKRKAVHMLGTVQQ